MDKIFHLLEMISSEVKYWRDVINNEFYQAAFYKAETNSISH